MKEKARRLLALIETKKGQKKFLRELYHGFQEAVRDDLAFQSSYDEYWDLPCFVFHESKGFGLAVSSFVKAYKQLSLDEGWLIISQDGSIGVYRPEARWDDEVLIKI